MKIIAIDSSGLTASVAILEDDCMIAEYSVNYKKTHSQTLLPMLDEISRMTELDLKTVDCIAVAKGPGSFTGLRIGSSTAKGLGFALNLPIAEVPTTDALAYNLFGTDKLVCPLMDARRDQVYTGLYDFTGGIEPVFNVIKPACALAIDEIIAEINSRNREVIFLGDGVKAFKDRIVELTTVPFSFAAPGLMMQRASSVAALGMQVFKEGKAVPASEHVPDYLRPSQAERTCGTPEEIRSNM
ncbi:MAG: tRNA (adenosine(37)-N6)-threonylcarbamoyltransferase complex dimerization subunit type 1 TsaB [Lachnospiraceae bacterium]|nr:tRNA (adenosine(37)-N6)-threonylcarbamoyltransferase complex dimerization subunit type 1 TsaB [Lachnospiraceae bacterium]